MPYSAEQIKEKIVKELPADDVLIEDTSDGCGAKFSAVIISTSFEGKPLIQRQRMVNGVIAEEMRDIHAFSQKTYTPVEWSKKQGA